MEQGSVLAFRSRRSIHEFEDAIGIGGGGGEVSPDGVDKVGGVLDAIEVVGDAIDMDAVGAIAQVGDGEVGGEARAAAHVHYDGAINGRAISVGDGVGEAVGVGETGQWSVNDPGTIDDYRRPLGAGGGNGDEGEGVAIGIGVVGQERGESDLDAVGGPALDGVGGGNRRGVDDLAGREGRPNPTRMG